MTAATPTTSLNEVKIAGADNPNGEVLFNRTRTGDMITFTAASGRKISVYVSSLEREGGGRYSWNLKGVTARTNLPFSGYYHTRNRVGRFLINPTPGAE